MAAGFAHTVLESASGSAGPLSVGLRRMGEGLQLVSLSQHAGPTTAAVDEEALAFVFCAPRAGADRYPDWADFEQSCRVPGTGESRVWRIAQDASRASFLAQRLSSPGPRLPVAAALWRGWIRPTITNARGLLWQGDDATHLWLVHPDQWPSYTRVNGQVPADELQQILHSLLDRREFTLEVGGVHPDVTTALAERLRGSVSPVEPFARIRVSVPLQEELCAQDPTAYLPAVGAALALLLGPPVPLSLCASSPAAAAGAY